MEYKQISQMAAIYPTGLNYKSEGSNAVGEGIEYEPIPFEVIDINTIVYNPDLNTTGSTPTLNLFPFGYAGQYDGENETFYGNQGTEDLYEWSSTIGWVFLYSTVSGPS